MAELSIGKHCNVVACNRLDFLPCPCNGCGLDYCKDHLFYDSHNCPRKDLIASATISDVLVEYKSYTCSVKNCDRKELVSLACDACGISICVFHRHPADHACKSITEQQDKMACTAEVVKRILAATDIPAEPNSAPKSQKSKAMAAKIALMKLKQKAVGDKGIPDVDRVFFKIILPLGSKTASTPVYISRNWTVGRAVDSLAITFGIRNDNNISTAKLLGLFDTSNGALLPHDKIISSLLETGKSQNETAKIYNGDSLILEYIDRGLANLPSVILYAKFL